MGRATFVGGGLLVYGRFLLIYGRFSVGYGTLCMRLWAPGKFTGYFD